MGNYSLFRKGCNSGKNVFVLRVVKYGHRQIPRFSLMGNYSIFRKGCNSGNNVFALRLVKYGHRRFGVARVAPKRPPNSNVDIVEICYVY